MKNILLVDDDQINNKMLTKKLEKKGYHVIQAYNGKECLEIFEDNITIDLVLLDIMMPDLSGSEVLKRLRKEKTQFELPIIMVTGKSDTEDIVENLRLGANDYIVKPVNIEVAEARVKTQLALSDLQKENLKKAELETAHAMIVTYNHEINNPLTIAMGLLRKILKHPEDKDAVEKNAPRVAKSLARIAEIVKKIEAVSLGNEVKSSTYAKDDKMVKLD